MNINLLGNGGKLLYVIQGLRYNGPEMTWSAGVEGRPSKGSSHWRLNVFSATGGFIWLHILYLIPCLIQTAL